MSQEAILATVKTFGPVSSFQLNRCLRQKGSSLSEGLRVLQHTGEVRVLSNANPSKKRGTNLWEGA